MDLVRSVVRLLKLCANWSCCNGISLIHTKQYDWLITRWICYWATRRGSAAKGSHRVESMDCFEEFTQWELYVTVLYKACEIQICYSVLSEIAEFGALHHHKNCNGKIDAKSTDVAETKKNQWLPAHSGLEATGNTYPEIMDRTASCKLLKFHQSTNWLLYTSLWN